MRASKPLFVCPWVLLLTAAGGAAQPNLGSTSIFNSFESAQDLQAVNPRSAAVQQTTDHVTDGHAALRVDFQVAAFPNILFDFSPQPRDWSKFGGLAFDVFNPSTTETVTLHLRMDDDIRATGAAPHSDTRSVALNPGTGGTAIFPFQDAAPLRMGMRASPPVPGLLLMLGTDSIDFTHVTSLQLFLSRPPNAQSLIFDNVRLFTAPGNAVVYSQIVDRYGQFTKQNWPGKASTDGDLKAAAQAESALPLPDPGQLDAYGGFTLGESLGGGAGFFRTAQDGAGRWWLVTPAGNRFFSIGIASVRMTSVGQTDIEGREFLFTELPAASDALSAFYTPAITAQTPISLAIQYNAGRSFDFYASNLWRKYGDGYKAAWMRATIDRFTRWGINTIANFSEPPVFTATGSEGQRVPYTASLSYSGNFARVVTPFDYWSSLVDPFDPAFARAVDSSFARQTSGYVNDPYLLGYFVDNELSWAGGANSAPDQNRYSLVYGVFSSGGSSPARQAFLQSLQQRYATIAQLNQAWNTQFSSWDQLLSIPFAAPAPLSTDAMRGDFSALLRLFAGQYFRIIGSAIKKYDPNHLYLGSRFGSFSLEEVQACAEFCDVISFNIYAPRLDAATWSFLHGMGKPAMIGEFHFGATDRGGFSGGLAPVPTQQDRAIAYALKLQDTATNPDFVGAHWFDYVDEPITGRMSDGENYAIGFVSVTDTPYPEFTAGVARANSTVYRLRLNVPSVPRAPARPVRPK